MSAPPVARGSFANSLATQIETLVWLLAVQNEYDSCALSMSDEFMVTHIEPVTTELLSIRKKIEVIRASIEERQCESGHSFKSNAERVQMHDHVLGADVIPDELTELSYETFLHDVTGSALSKEIPPWELQADIVPNELSPVPSQDRDLEEPACSKSLPPPGMKAYTKHNEPSLLQQEAGPVEESVALNNVMSQMTAFHTGTYAANPSTDVIDMGSGNESAVLEELTGTKPYKTFRILDIWQFQERQRSHPFAPRAHVPYPLRVSSISTMRNSSSQSTWTDKPGESQSSLGCIVIPPGSFVRTLWDLMIFVLVIQESILIPMEYLDLPSQSFFQVMGWVVRLFWTVDLGLNFITGYINDHGLCEMRLVKIFKRYARTWLVPDIFLVASDWVDMAVGGITSESGLVRLGKSTRLSRSLRAFRLVRMGKALQLVTRSKFSATSDKLMAVVDIVRICAVFVLFTHLVACLWFGLGAWEAQYGSQTWLHDADMMDDPVGSRYLVSFIWALAQFSGGTDFPYPQNVAERLFNVITLLICFVASAAFVSFLTRSTTQLLLLSSGPSQQMRQLRDYLAQHHVSMRLVQRIQKNAHFVAFGQRRATVEEDVELLHRISKPLQTQLAMEIRGPVLMVHPFFENYSQFCFAGMREVCEGATKTRAVLSDDVLFMKDQRQLEPHMFFVYLGTMSYQKTKACSNIVSPGEWIAEMVLWTDWAHRGTFAAVSYCQVISVHAKSFYDVVKKNDHSLEASILYAQEFVIHLNKIKPTELTDLCVKKLPAEGLWELAFVGSPS